MVNGFTYMFGIKALAKHVRFWYVTSRGVDVQGIGGLHSNMGQWKDEFSFTILDVLGSLGLHVSGDQLVALPPSSYHYIFVTHFSSQIPAPVLCSRRRRQSI